MRGWRWVSAALLFTLAAPPIEARTSSPNPRQITARSAAILDANTGDLLFSKNAHLKLPPASTTKVMTAMVVLEHLPLDARIRIGRNAVNAAPSKAGLTPGASYTVQDLVSAILVASSNDAAVALAEAVANDESRFAELMNDKAARLGMKNTHFINASGLPVKKKGAPRQYSTAYDLSRLMWYASRDRRIDETMALVKVSIAGSDGRRIDLRTHNKMLWKTPGLVKGKTGWTYASRHTFMGTNFTNPKKYTFAMLSSTKPWLDIQMLAFWGSAGTSRGRFAL